MGYRAPRGGWIMQLHLYLDDLFPSTISRPSFAIEMKPLLLMACAALSAAGVSSPVSAHAFLDHATPAAGSTIHVSPPRVELSFTEELEPAFSTVRVLDQTNRRRDNGDAKVDPRDPTALQVSLPALAPGRYRVEWRVLSVDTHISEGNFTFVLAP